MAPISNGALLWVISEPGSEVTNEEFTDWYDNEHVPLRMGSLLEFLTGARFQAIDGIKPSWSASYEVTDPILFTQHKYTKLRANRSPREACVIGRLALLDRRTYTTKLFDTSYPPAYAAGAPSIKVTVATDEKVAESLVEDWKSIKGWRRSHAYQLQDSLLIGFGKQLDTKAALPFVVVHEFDDADDVLASSALKEATAKAREVRVWKLYRAWDNTAPKE